MSFNVMSQVYYNYFGIIYLTIRVLKPYNDTGNDNQHKNYYISYSKMLPIFTYEILITFFALYTLWSRG